LTTLWFVWLTAAVALVLCSALAPFNSVFVGLLLGSSLSHAIESSLRGSITDYVCLRIWPAFNLADLALTAGAIGIMGELIVIIHQKVF
jgi:lipoprotein signal peptidase